MLSSLAQCLPGGFDGGVLAASATHGREQSAPVMSPWQRLYGDGQGAAVPRQARKQRGRMTLFGESQMQEVIGGLVTDVGLRGLAFSGQ